MLKSHWAKALSVNFCSRQLVKLDRVQVGYALGDSGIGYQARISRLLTALMHPVNSLVNAYYLCAAY